MNQPLLPAVFNDSEPGHRSHSDLPVPSGFAHRQPGKHSARCHRG
jgi:hypothetical protein